MSKDNPATLVQRLFNNVPNLTHFRYRGELYQKYLIDGANARKVAGNAFVTFKGGELVTMLQDT